MDWTALIEGVGMIAGLLGAVISLWVRSTVDKKVYRARDELIETEIEPLQKQNAAQHLAIVQLEAKCAAMATREDFHKMDILMAGMGGDLKSMRVSMENLHDEQKAMRHSVQRVNDFLLNGNAAR